MTAANSTAEHVEILPGVRHYKTSGFAQTWAAYDALTSDDGWIEKTPAYPGYEPPPGERKPTWKDGIVNGRAVVVFAPHHERDDEREAA